MPEILFVATVGGSPAPIVFALNQLAAAPRAIFICSPATLPSLSAIRSAAVHPLPEAACDTVVVPDPEDLASLVAQLRREVAPMAANWLARGPGFHIAVNFTGGTKAMSAALVVVAQSWPSSTVAYIGGLRRDPAGQVLSGSEHLRQSPTASFDTAPVNAAIALTHSGDWPAAAALLRSLLPQSSDPLRARSLASLHSLVHAFAAWDRFDHQAAAVSLAGAAKNRNDLAVFLTPASARAFDHALPVYQQRLDTLTAPVESPADWLPRIADLLANAGRRLREQRFDDATARAYRAIEALAQYRLAVAHGIASTSNPERLPQAFDHPAGAPLGLQDAYRLLRFLEDPVGQAFQRLGLPRTADKAGPLEARNSSILAHGWSPVGPSTAVNLVKAATELMLATAGPDPAAAIEFPNLQPL